MTIKDLSAAVTQETERMVQYLLHSAPFKFYLTGSRFFGYHTEASDWDFFVGVPEGGVSQLQEWLLSFRFRKDENHDYDDSFDDLWHDALEVWLLSYPKIHVQIVRDPVSKNHVQNIVKYTPGMVKTLRLLPKENRGPVWKMARALYAAGREREERKE